MIDLFPAYLDVFAIDEVLPTSDAVPDSGRKWSPSGRSKVIQCTGDGCNLCSRHSLREGDAISKPRMVRGTTSERMLVVLSQSTLDAATERITTSTIRGRGYTGHILYDFAFRCGTLSPKGGAALRQAGAPTSRTPGLPSSPRWSC